MLQDLRDLIMSAKQHIAFWDFIRSKIEVTKVTLFQARDLNT